MTTSVQILDSYYLPRFGIEDEQQRVYLGKLFANIHAILEEILAVVPADANAKYLLWDTPPATLPNAHKLVAGTNITLVDTTGVTTINAAASGITALTGVVTATGPGSVASTLNIDSLTAKITPVAADEFALADSAASFVSKKVTFANLQTALGTGTTTGTGLVDTANVISLAHSIFVYFA